VHELRSAAIGVLERQRARLTARDLPWLVDLVCRSNTWAHVDWIAPKVIGDVIARYPRARSHLTRWAADDNFWVRRTALLAEHDALRAGGGDFALFARLAAGMLDEREFFIRKAIGWVLREVSKRRPELVYGFLRDHRDRASRLTLQEGAKYLPVGRRLGLGLSAQVASVERGESRKRVNGDPAGPALANRHAGSPRRPAASWAALRQLSISPTSPRRWAAHRVGSHRSSCRTSAHSPRCSRSRSSASPTARSSHAAR